MRCFKIPIIIKSLCCKYSKKDFQRWCEGDPSFVPAYLLETNSKKLHKDYGFNEYLVERDLKSKGYNVIVNSFDLSGFDSKYKNNNITLSNVMGIDKYNELEEAFRGYESQGKGKIEQSEVFAYKDNHYLFIKIKKNRDILKETQINFARLLKEELKIDFIIYILNQVDRRSNG